MSDSAYLASQRLGKLTPFAARLFLLTLATWPLSFGQEPPEILRRTAETYRNAHSYEAIGTLHTQVEWAGTAYDLAWPVSLAQADSTLLPPDSPVPSLSPLLRFGAREFRDSGGAIAHPEKSPSSPNGWPVFDQVDQAVKQVRSFSTDTIAFGGKAAACWVLEVDYESGFPTRALSGRPVRYWIDQSSNLVLRQSFTLRDSSAGEVRAWLFEASAVKINDPPPAWALAALPSLAGKERADWVNRPAPEFSLRDLKGREVRLSDLRGKAVVLSFWATWCAPCKEELPILEEMRAEFGPQGLEVWGVNNESGQKARQWLSRYGYDFPTLVDAKRQAFQAYEANKIPVSVVVDRNGRVVSYLEGLGGEAYFRAAIEKALSTWDSGP